MKNTMIILSTCFLLLFACQPEVQRKQEVLTSEQLAKQLLKMNAFHRFLEVEQQLEEEIANRRSNLDKKDHWWIINIHEKYPTIEKFLEQAPIASIRKYQLLTAIELIEEDSEIRSLLKQIHEELRERYVFQTHDLHDRLFFSNQQEMFEESYAKNNCLRLCNREADDEFERVYESCERADLLYCQYKAFMARHYFHRGCMAGCNRQEE